MVHYIRLLKPPKLDIQKCIVRALITITTDLGDDFYASALTVYAAVVSEDLEESEVEWQQFPWKRGSRNVWIEIGKLDPKNTELVRLLVTTQRTAVADTVRWNNLPEILSARSEAFGWKNPQAGDRIERSYRTEQGNRRVLYEETGESIARHIWDAGIGLVAFLNDTVLQPQRTSLLAMILRMYNPRGPRVLELGSGCGIVGLEVALISPQSDVFLTDLPEAMEILNYNVSKVTGSNPALSNIATAVLNWDDANSNMVQEHQYDLVIVSDCTYNADSIPSLVKTVAAVIDRSPAAMVVVSMKVRHDSEAIFFDLMTAAGFVTAEHAATILPDQQRADSGQAHEVVDIYVFGNNKDIEQSWEISAETTTRLP